MTTMTVIQSKTNVIRCYTKEEFQRARMVSFREKTQKRKIEKRREELQNAALRIE